MFFFTWGSLALSEAFHKTKVTKTRTLLGAGLVQTIHDIGHLDIRLVGIGTDWWRRGSHDACRWVLWWLVLERADSKAWIYRGANWGGIEGTSQANYVFRCNRKRKLGVEYKIVRGHPA